MIESGRGTSGPGLGRPGSGPQPSTAIQETNIRLVLSRRAITSVRPPHGALSISPWSLQSDARREGQILLGADVRLLRDHPTCHQPEGHLGDDKPPPVDSIREIGVDQGERGMKNARPQDRGDDATQEHRMPRQHGQHSSVEKPDEQRADDMDDGGRRSARSGGSA